MNTFVIDASVGAKWILPDAQEAFTQQAVAILREWAEGNAQIVVPDFFWIELANILWKAIRRGRITRPGAEAAMGSLRREKIPTVSYLRLLDSAFPMAIIYDCSVYDCLYVALAAESNGVLITADEKIAKALASSFPVKWLGAI